MNRIALKDGRWFDSDRAKKWQESTYFDGNNHISNATGSQWNHETLYLTAGGAWILHSWSQWQGTTERYEIINDDEACRWLVRNGHEMPKTLEAAEKELEV